MKTLLLSFLGFCMMLSVQALAAEPDTRCFELRVYYPAPGRLDDIVARFRDHTCKLFEKHGFQNIGYWVAKGTNGGKLVYIIASPNREAHVKSWKAFGEDPAWHEVVKKTEANGRIVTRVDSTFLKATDFSPAIKSSSSAKPRCFEWRTYTAGPGKLDDLLARFRNHTVKLFEKHGMTNIGYWVPVDEKSGAGTTLTYILAHESQEAGAESFKNFRADPEWVEVKKNSETNGVLATKVVSEYMTPTDFSAIK